MTSWPWFGLIKSGQRPVNLARGLTAPNASGNDLWSGAGPPAHSSKRFRSLHVPVARSVYGTLRAGAATLVLAKIAAPGTALMPRTREWYQAVDRPSIAEAIESGASVGVK